MFQMRFPRYPIYVMILIVSASVSMWTQTPETTPRPVDPANKPKKVKDEPNDVFKRWLDQDVIYIISAAEKKAFEQLKTNEERESFIKFFWNSRDPDPDTEVNEFREEFYGRIAYANENYASGVPGWKTDRGRIYITWGKPDSIESHPSGGSYDRPSYEGGGATTTYPFETWFYRHLDGVGDGVEVEFVDQSGTGEYRIARTQDEKVALANVPGVGHGNETLNQPKPYQRAQDSQFSRLSQIVALQTPPNPKFGDLYRTIIDGPVLDNNPLAFDIRIDNFRMSDDRVIAMFTIRANNRDLVFDQKSGLATASLNILGRITTVSNRRGGIFEDSVTTTATPAELTDAKARYSIYQKPIALQPGIYKLDVIIRDVAAGNRGFKSIGFTVPKYDPNLLSTSTLVLASKLRPADASNVGGQFVIGDLKLVPDLGGVFARGQDIGVYLQVYNAQIDQTTLRPAVDVDYVLLKDGREVMRRAEDWSGISDTGQRLTLARLLPSNALEPGEYEIKVEVRDRVKGNTIVVKGNFTLTK